MMITRNLYFFACLIFASFISACGGGGGAGNVSTNLAETSNLTISARTIRASASTTPGYKTNGTLNFDIIWPATATFPAGASATVQFSAPLGTLTISKGLNPGVTVTTANSWSSRTYSTGLGIVALEGNANLYCASPTTGYEILLSSNLIPVTSYNELQGKTFAAYYCDSLSNADQFSIDAAGTVSAGGEIISAQSFTSLFTGLGTPVGFGTGEWSRLSAYKTLIAGRYVYVIAEEGQDAGGTYLGLIVEQ
jgi:hypothetical protein